MNFILNNRTRIVNNLSNSMTIPVKNAIHILERDLEKVVGKKQNISFDLLKNNGTDSHNIILSTNSQILKEDFQIHINRNLVIEANDDLGFIYGLLRISNEYLGVKPFWFWMNQEIKEHEEIVIPFGSVIAKKPLVRFRGWFFNDEVLLLQWNVDGTNENTWRMAFEALLRCGGNMAIPGTDLSARNNAKLASEYGLWLTHHHAEPLGAQMFSRVFPKVRPNYSENSALFHKLWEDSIKEQAGYNVVWNLGFRGQGDCPFWSTDNSGAYNTEEKRGKLISELIGFQRGLVEAHIENPVFCTNLYGEVMELYEKGLIHIDDDIIKVSADNGYGKMVTRRRDSHSLRISSLPKERINHGGIYYHVSFYDLQAANHITMLPNSVEFVNEELNKVIDKNAIDFWAINCSNVKPHTYFLDFISKKWFDEDLNDSTQSEQFVRTYYNNNPHIAKTYVDYAKAMLSYGIHKDEHIGEQFYTETIRIFASNFIKDRNSSAPQLYWLTGNIDLEQQLKKIVALCENGLEGFTRYYMQCVSITSKLTGPEKKLYEETILLHVSIHYHCIQGVLLYGQGYEAYLKKDYKDAFIYIGLASESFDKSNEIMRGSEEGVWKGYYYNDCFADFKHTAYMCRKVMGVLRELGDNVRHDKWYREECYSEKDRDIFLLLVLDNHYTDQELFKRMKKNRGLS